MCWTVECRDLWRNIEVGAVTVDEVVGWGAVNGVREVVLESVEPCVLAADASDKSEVVAKGDLCTGAEAGVEVVARDSLCEATDLGIASRDDVVDVGVHLLVVEEGSGVCGRAIAEEACPPSGVRGQVPRWVGADEAGGASGLVDVTVVEDKLIAECGVAGKIVLPSSSEDGALIEAAQTCLCCSE